MPGIFTTTVWNAIHQAKSGDPEAVNRLLAKYRPPVVAFLRSRGHSPEEAEDLAQEVFLVIVRDDLLARAEEQRGRFRDFIRGIAKNVAANARRTRNAAKRGAGLAVVPLSVALEEVPSPEVDAAFDGEWIRHLVTISLGRLRESDERYHQALVLQRDEGKSLQEVGAALNLTPKQAGNLLQQARRKLGDLIRREVQAYSSSTQEYRDELAHVKRFLGISEKA